MDTNIIWDPKKEKSNLKKHGIAFPVAVSTLEDEEAITIEDDHPGERRFITIGKNENGKILVVVYTYRGGVIRIISARKATAAERDVYKG